MKVTPSGVIFLAFFCYIWYNTLIKWGCMIIDE